MSEWHQTSVASLYGVGKAKQAAYARLGVYSVGDLLEHYPRAYENRGDVRLLSDTVEDGKSAVVLTVASAPRVSLIRRGMSLLKFRAYDDSGVCEITFFNQDYHKDAFAVGQTFRFYGKVERKGGRYAMSSPAFEAMAADGQTALPALFPIYPLTEGLTQKQLCTNVAMALRLAATDLEESLPHELMVRRELCAYSYALRQIHAPEHLEALSCAKRRLIYDEFLLFALGMAISRARVKSHAAPACDRGDLGPLEALLPYTLTDAQRRTIEQIRVDMSKTTPMSRMIVGDVGCGKTVCAAAAMLFAVQSGRQAALMAPTEILARQHAAELSDLFGRLGIQCELLVGATPASEKKRIRQALAEKDAQKRLWVVIGTQALLSEGVEFACPGLVVTDEQHRFGVAQRARLSEKSGFAHLLVMSATPIPRSLALALYGDLDVCRIDQMPPGRQEVSTYVVDESYRSRLDAFIQKQVAGGGQVYVVCPSIEEQESVEPGELPMSEVSLRSGVDVLTCQAPPLRSAVQYARALAARLPSVTVACMHGKMKAAQKDDIMRKFVSGEISVLVSTTVIEVGVNVPRATLMIVENAERFGLSQLHQLRGRVGRGEQKSFCVLVKGAPQLGEIAERRLVTMERERDGFQIAKQDLLARGPGDFLRGSSDASIRQSGGLHLRLADQCDDAELMQAAFEDAGRLLAEDEGLLAHPVLRARVEKLFSVENGLIS